MIEENKIDPEFDYEKKGDLTDHLVEPAHKPELSPNPQGSGYLKQVKVNSLPVSPEENVLYILPDGRQFKWNNSLAQYVRVENGPAYLKSKGQHGTPVHENTKPGIPPRVFADPVSFLNDVFVKGKKLEDYIDSQGGVTEQEMVNYVSGYVTQAIANGVKVHEIDDILLDGAVIEDFTEQLKEVKPGDIIIDSGSICVAIVLSIWDSGIEMVGFYYEGVVIPYKWYTEQGIIKEMSMYNSFFTDLTHSFAELDDTLRTIVESAVEDGGQSGVACTQAQWNTIKGLLDKSLFINYRGYSIIKTATDGISNYHFGGVLITDTYCVSLVLLYDSGNQKLMAYYTEI